MRVLFLFFISIYLPLLTSAQMKNVYLIEKVKDDLHVKSVRARPVVSIGVEIYKVLNGKKIDSLYRSADDFKCWNDSVIISLHVPINLFSLSNEIFVRPIYHFAKNNNKGGAANFQLGNIHPLTIMKLKIKSDPSGVEVFLIPKIILERNPQLAHYDLSALSRYLVSEGTTTVITNVQEYVYVAIYYYKNKFFPVQCAPNHLNDIDSVYKKLN